MLSRRDVVKLGAAGLIAPALGSAVTPEMSLAQDTSGGVPMFRGNAARTGEMPGPTPSLDKPIIVKWRFSTDSAITDSSPAVVSGTVFVGSHDHNIYAIDASSGEERWRFSTSDRVWSSPAVVDGSVYIGSSDNHVYAIDASSGEERWRFATDFWVGSSPIVVDSTVFVGCRGSNLYAIDATSGEERWRFTTGYWVESSPAVVDGTVFVGSLDHNVYAIDAASGEERWRFTTSKAGPDSVSSSPAVVDGTIFVGTSESSGASSIPSVHAIDAASGEERWRFTTSKAGPNDVSSSPAVVDGNVFIGGTDHNVIAIDSSSGTEQWRFITGGHVTSSPTVANDTVFVGSWDHNLYAIDAMSGEERWHFDTGDQVSSSPAVVDGMVFVGGHDGNLYAIGNLETAVLTADVTLRGAPSTSGVERSTAEAGDEIDHVGAREERNGRTWAEVTIGDSTGWIPLDAIDPATLPPEGEIEYVYIPD